MTFKRLDGRDEAIVEPALPIVDSHFRLFDLPGSRYMFEDYLADVRARHNIVASVYIETRAFARPDGPEALRPFGEVEFANGVGAMSANGVYGPRGLCAAIVGYADLRLGEAVGALFDLCLARADLQDRSQRHDCAATETCDVVTANCGLPRHFSAKH
jgi:hypothetical protein